MWLASEYPEAKLILAHWGGLLLYEMNPTVHSKMANVFYDTAASPLLFDKSIFRTVVNAIGSERLLYGSDYPLRLYPSKSKTPDFRTFLEDIRSTGLLQRKLRTSYTATHENFWLDPNGVDHIPASKSFPIPRKLGDRCMVHSLEDGSHLAFLDFDDVQRIENIDIDIPDALTRLLDDTFVDHDHFPFRCGFLGYELLAAHFASDVRLCDLNFPAALLARPSTQIQIFDKNLITTSFHSRRALELKNLASKRLTSPNAEIRNLKPNLSTEEYEKIFRSAKETSWMATRTK